MKPLCVGKPELMYYAAAPALVGRSAEIRSLDSFDLRMRRIDDRHHGVKALQVPCRIRKGLGHHTFCCSRSLFAFGVHGALFGCS